MPHTCPWQWGKVTCLFVHTNHSTEAATFPAGTLQQGFGWLVTHPLQLKFSNSPKAADPYYSTQKLYCSSLQEPMPVAVHANTHSSLQQPIKKKGHQNPKIA